MCHVGKGRKTCRRRDNIWIRAPNGVAFGRYATRPMTISLADQAAVKSEIDEGQLPHLTA